MPEPEAAAGHEDETDVSAAAPLGCEDVVEGFPRPSWQEEEADI